MWVLGYHDTRIGSEGGIWVDCSSILTLLVINWPLALSIIFHKLETLRPNILRIVGRVERKDHEIHQEGIFLKNELKELS